MDNSSRRSKAGAWIKMLVGLLIIAAALWVVMNRQFVVDSVATWRYQPSPEIVAIADRSGMSDRGKFLFYASRPVVSDREEFISQCSAHSEQTAILGCYSAMRIYLFDVDDKRLDGIKEVTAAHEMLHAAYDRLSDTEKSQVAQAVEIGYEAVKNERLIALLEMYEKSEPGQRSNELFAILGTEYADLPAELKTIYTRYFDDREAVVSLAQQYQSTFEDIANRQASVVEEMNRLATQITADSERYNQLVAQLDQDVADFNRRAEAGDFESQAAFNNERAELVSRQEQLALLRESIDRQIARYEQLSAQLDDINMLVNELNRSINPNLVEAPEL